MGLLLVSFTSNSADIVVKLFIEISAMHSGSDWESFPEDFLQDQALTRARAKTRTVNTFFIIP